MINREILTLEVKCEHCGAAQTVQFSHNEAALITQGGMLCFYCGDIFGWKFVTNEYGEYVYEYWR